MRTSGGLDRFLTFLDAVVAIAITLLVLPLVDIVTERRDGETVAHLLGDHLGVLLAFLLSFVVIARLWLVHHEMFERVESYDAWVLRWSLLWAFTIVVLPFPTELLGSGTDNGRVGFALYVGTLTVSSIALTALGVHVARTAAIRVDQTTAHLPVGALVTTGLNVVALVLGLLVPAIGYYALLLQFISGPVTTLIRRDTAAD